MSIRSKSAMDGEQAKSEDKDDVGIELFDTDPISAEGDQVRRGTRERVLTEKGSQFKVDVMTKELKGRISGLNKLAQTVSGLISGSSTSLQELINVQEKYEFEWKGVAQCYKYMLEFTTGKVDEDITRRFENIESISSGILLSLANAIRELRSDLRS